MFGGLRKKLNEVWSGLDFYDQKENQQQRQQFAAKRAAPARTVSQPRQVAPATTQRRIDDSYGGGFSGLQNRIRDKFDANTQADRIRRLATSGLDESYEQEQARKTKEANNTEAKRNAANQFSAGGLSGVVDFFGKTPGAMAQVQGRATKTLNSIDNPILRTGAKLIAPGGATTLFQNDKQADKLIKTGQQTNQLLENKKQQSGIGQRKDDNRLVYGAGQLATQLPAQIATGGAGLAMTGAQTTADQANQAQKAGKSNNYALATGLLQGGATALSEKFGIDKFLPGNNVTGNLTTRLVKRAFTEGGQEAQQQFTSNLIANKAYNPNQGLTEGVAESALLGSIAGAGMSGAIDIPGVFRRPPKAPVLSPQDIAVLSDLQDVNYKRIQDPRVVTQVLKQAREIGAKNGVDLVTGSVSDINDRVNGLIDNFYNQQPKLTTSLVKPKPMNQGGYIQLPGGRDTQLNDTELGVVNYLNNKPTVEGSAVQGEGNAIPTNLDPSTRQSYLDKMKKMVKPLNDGGYAQIPFGKEVADGLSKEQTEFINDYANMLEDMGSGNGIGVNPETNTRMSGNVRLGDTGGKNMTKADWFDEAKRQIESGEAMYNAGEDYKALPKAEVKTKQPKTEPKTNLVLGERQLPDGSKIQKVRVGKGKIEERTVEAPKTTSDQIADALNIPKSDRTPTADDQRVQRVEEATQNSVKNATPQDLQKELEREQRVATPPSSIKEKAKRQTFEQVTKEYLGKTKSAQIERSAILADLNKRFKLNDKEKINAILARDDPNVKPMNQKVSEYIKEFKRNTDVAYSEYKAQGVKMGYVSSYLPRIYKNPTTGQEIDAVEFKLLQQGSKRMKGRDAEKVAVDWLVEKDPTKLLERYYNSMDKAVAGRQYLEKLENNGLVTISTEPVRGLRPIVAEGLQTENGIYYAQKDVATKLNELFGSKEANNLVEKTLEKGAGVNSLFQSFVLSGGVPNTPINAFGIMQVMKEGMALHPIKAGKAFTAGMSKSYANKVFTAKKDIMRKMVENDIDLRVDLTQQGKSGRARVKDAFKDSKAQGINEAWNEFTNDSTFGRFMPMLEVLHFENIYKSAINRGASDADAGRLAADSTKNFYGKTGNYKLETRSKSAQDAAGAVFFAPRFRESMVNFWVKNAKALNPKNLGKVEYRDNQKFMAASALTYAAMTMLNEALNGVQLWDNPDGKKDKLIIPASALEKMGIQTKGKDIAIPFLPSLATVPRNLASLAGNFATGKFNEAGKNAKAFLSMPLKTAGDILTNEDYFGNKIVQDESSPFQKFTQAGSYIAASNMQPWIREGLNALGQDLPKDVKKTFGIKEKSTFEALSNAGEAPLRFYNPDTYRFGDNWVPKGGKDEKFTFKQQRERAAIKGELNNIAKSIGMNKRQEELFKSLSSVEFNEDGTLKEDKNPFYKSQRYTALQDDKVYEGMKQKAKLNAKLNGKPIDPIFDDNLAPDQRRVLLWKKTLPPGTSDPTVKKLYEQDWYQDYRNKESKYFENKTAWNKKMGYKDGTPNTNEYPMASKDVEAGQNTYFDLPKGGARTAFRNNNPQLWSKMIAYWDSKDAWTNGERSKLGLGALEDEYANSGSGSRSGGGGRGGKKGSKYDYTKDLFAGNTGSTSKALRKILEEAMNAKLV